MPQRDPATLLDILNAARLVTKFIEGFDRAAFELDAKTPSAVTLQLIPQRPTFRG